MHIEKRNLAGALDERDFASNDVGALAIAEGLAGSAKGL
jgi:hypothetical protein